MATGDKMQRSHTDPGCLRNVGCTEGTVSNDSSNQSKSIKMSIKVHQGSNFPTSPSTEILTYGT
jgi:hypothetical protein